MTVPVKEDDLNQTVRRDSCTVSGGEFFCGIQAKGHIIDFAIHANAIGFVRFKALYKVDFHPLTLIVKTCGCFRHFDFLSCIHKLYGMNFVI